MTENALRTADRNLLNRAHNLLSGILQNDYLSDGRGHKRLRKLMTNDSQSTVTRQPEKVKPAPRLVEEHFVDDALEVADASGPIDTADDIDSLEAIESVEADGYQAPKATRARLSSSDEYQLVRAARAGSTTARDKLILHNLGLVEMIARRYANSARMPMDDLVAEGNFGLFEAIERFDPEYGYRFASYAKWWVRQCIDAAVMSQSRVVRLPAHVNRELRKKPIHVEEPNRVNPRFASRLMTDISNVEAYGDSTESISVLDNMPADDSSSPDFALDQQKQLECLLAALNSLCEEDRSILYARFGIGRDEPMTLEDLAKEMGRSGERVRQIQVRATTRLREVLLKFGIRDASLSCSVC
jgi:RNA polymerase nonessential primary-like sigma factor